MVDIKGEERMKTEYEMEKSSLVKSLVPLTYVTYRSDDPEERINTNAILLMRKDLFGASGFPLKVKITIEYEEDSQMK